ncbi:MAG: FecR domain-containing protein [Leptospiraceae bacterium]|nr:FecR domain-containing protein [Leptospiraceae bacterium]MCP5496706.1 FecR domain-containing protein [Leptospiraceae bacterium]
MNFLYGRKLVVLILSSLIFLFSYLLYSDIKQEIQVHNTQIIGIIASMKRTIHRKPNGRVVWREIRQDMPIMNFDTIRTGELANAEIILSDGTKINMEENTMVLIELSKNSLDIDFVQGKISTERKSKNSLNIHSHNRKITMQNGNISLFNGDKQDLHINLTQGKATIKTPEFEKEIEAQQMAIVNDNSIHLLGKDNERIASQSPKLNTPSSTQKKAASPSKPRPLIQKPKDKIKIKAKMLYPIQKASIDMSFKKSLDFRWKKIPKTNYYQLKLYQLKKRGREKLILKKAVKQNYYKITDLSILDIGKYRWELSGKSKSSDTVISTAKEYFSITLSEQPSEAPDIISPTERYK